MILLVLTALIWGVAFVAQSQGSEVMGAYSFNCVRFLLGAAVLILVIMLLDRMGLSGKKPVDSKDRKLLWKGGVLCGIFLAIASNLQQLGITFGTSAGKAGFLTACYIIIVPILGIFLKKKCKLNVWVGVALSAAGLYLLCIKDTFTLGLPDILLLLCALMFAIQILLVDKYASMLDTVRLSFVEFLVCGLLSSIPMFFVDMNGTFADNQMWAMQFTSAKSWIAILYAGIFSCGIAYTLQVVGQTKVSPTIASLIFSLESVFSVLAGWVILGETLTVRELTGCILIFAAIIIAQLKFGKTEVTGVEKTMEGIS